MTPHVAARVINLYAARHPWQTEDRSVLRNVAQAAVDRCEIALIQRGDECPPKVYDELAEHLMLATALDVMRGG